MPVAQANVGIGLLYRVDSGVKGRWMVTGSADRGFEFPYVRFLTASRNAVLCSAMPTEMRRKVGMPQLAPGWT